MNRKWLEIKRAIRLQIPPKFASDAGSTADSRAFEAAPDIFPVVTYTTLLISAVLFYFTEISTGGDYQLKSEMLNRLGHRDDLNIVIKDWWSIFGNTLFHGGMIHFFFNGMAMLTIGAAFERGIGTLKTLLFFLLFGGLTTGYQVIVSNLDLFQYPASEFARISHHWYRYTPFESSLGLSGILFALIGFMWGSWKRWTSFLTVFNQQVLYFAFMWQGLCFMVNFIDGFPFKIANTAHVSGLMIGFFAGMWMCYGAKGAKLWFGLFLLMLITVIAGLTYYHFYFSEVLKDIIPKLKSSGQLITMPLFK